MENIYLSFVILLTVILNSYHLISIYYLRNILTDFINLIKN